MLLNLNRWHILSQFIKGSMSQRVVILAKLKSEYYCFQHVTLEVKVYRNNLIGKEVKYETEGNLAINMLQQARQLQPAQPNNRLLSIYRERRHTSEKYLVC